MNNELLNAQEVADILKIARNTVYELVKRGELASSKVGKQVRVDRREVEAYLSRTKQTDPAGLRHTQSYPARENRLYAQLLEDTIHSNELIICGQDISLDILTNYLSSMAEAVQIYRSYLGSYNGIYALYQGRVNVATAHLWDGDKDEYNLSYVKKMMPGIPLVIIRIGKRKQGFYVQKNNPKEITGWADLKRNDILMVNREKGSGTRVLLDEKLRLMGMTGEGIEGYARECKSHLAVANTISRGGADIGLGSELGAKNTRGIEFIPLQTECYDLIIRLTDARKQPYRTMLEIIASEVFKMDLQSIGGYDTEETGVIIEGKL